MRALGATHKARAVWSRLQTLDRKKTFVATPQHGHIPARLLLLKGWQSEPAAEMAAQDAEECAAAGAGLDDEGEALLRPEPDEEAASCGGPPAAAATQESAGGPYSAELLAQLSLIAVAFIWGTYSPALRYLYESTEGPPSPAVLTAVRGVIQAALLLLPSLLSGALASVCRVTIRLRALSSAGRSSFVRRSPAAPPHEAPPPRLQERARAATPACTRRPKRTAGSGTCGGLAWSWPCGISAAPPCR